MQIGEGPGLVTTRASGGGISRRDFILRALGAGLSLGATGSLLAACGGSTEGSSKTISLWHGWAGADNTEMLNAVLDKFNKENRGGIKIEPTAFQWDSLFSKLTVSAASGKAPNVVMVHTSELPEFAQRGILQPIGDLVEQAGFDFGGVPEEAVKGAEWEGERYAVTGDLHPLGMYYKTGPVEEVGLDPGKPPETGDEFLDWAEKLTVRKNGKVSQYGVSLPSRADPSARWLWYSLLNQYGGTFLDDRGKAAVDSPESRDALQFVVDLFYEHKVADPGVVGGPNADPVGRGNVAMWFIGPWDVNLRMRQKLEFATAPLPVVGERPAAWANTHCQAIPKQRDDSQYQNDVAFMKWFYDNYALPAAVVGVIPVNPKALKSKEFTQDKRHKYYEPFISELDYAVLEPRIPQYTTIFSFAKQTPLTTNIEAALSRSKSVEQALRDMKQGIDEQLTA